ncbi:hypothetical protein ACLIA0_10195 [Bacillaceae bacterium W0354]
MKDRVFWWGIGIIIVSFIINFTYFQIKQLDEPIVLEHYIELTYNADDLNIRPTFEFYYLTNKDDTEARSITFGDNYAYTQDQGFLFHQTNYIPHISEFSHYYLKKNLFEITPHNIKNHDTYTFEDGEISFYRQKGNYNLSLDIGEIILRNYIYDKDKYNKINQYRSGSGNGLNSNFFLVNEAVTIEKIHMPFPDVTKDIGLKIHFEHKSQKNESTYFKTRGYNNILNKPWKDIPGEEVTEDLFPIKLNEGDHFLLVTNFENVRDKYFSFFIRIEGKDSHGEPFKDYANVSSSPHLNKDSLKQLISGGEQ